MKNTAIFYGPVGGSTELVAKKMQEIIGAGRCDLVPVRDAKEEDLQKYSNIIFGIATIGKETWDAEPVKSGWFSFMNILEDASIEGKTVAIYGLGDQVRYADHFVDSMGDLYNLLLDKKVNIIGSVDTADYEFKSSAAVVDGKFVGLPLDEDFESEMTYNRINNWLQQILTQLS